MKKIIPIKDVGDVIDIMNHNADYISKVFKSQRKFNKSVVLFTTSITFWAYLQTAQTIYQKSKIKELEKRLAELEPTEGEKGQE